MTHRGSRIAFSFAVMMLVVFLPLVIAAQEPPRGAESIKEESIYIPYKKLREVFEKEGRVVFMPYDKFLELWRERLERTPIPELIRPPVDALITEISNVATVSKDVVTVSSVLKIEVLKEGWTEVPLRLQDAAITKATLDMRPARIVLDKAQGYRLLVEKQGKPPQSFTLNLEFARAYTKNPGQNSVSFETPQAPVSRWEVRIPEEGVKVNIYPLLAATQVPGAAGAKETVVLAFVGAAPTVRIDWTPKAEGARGLEALSSVKVEQQMDIEEGVTRTRAELAYAISRAQLPSLVVEVPADQKIVNVFDPNVREWSVETAGAVQKITAQLFEPARTSQNLTIELQKFAAEGTQTVGMPLVRAVGVGRQQGLVVVRVAPGLRAEATSRSGLLQVDASELPPRLAGVAWHFSYRYAALPFELTLTVEKIEPYIEADSLVEVHLQPEELILDMLTVYDVQRAGVFRLELDIPSGYEVRHVLGSSTGKATAVQVDTHHLEGPNKTHLVVNLSRKAMGKVGVAVRLYKRLAEPDLLTPTGKSASIPLVLPQVTPASVARRTGRAIVYAPESLRVNPGETKGLRSISFAEAVADMRSTQNPSVERPVLAFAYTDEPTSLTLAAERRKPQVTARTLLVARLEPGVVKYNVTLFYDILYSGVKSLRLDVPTDLASDIRITTPGVRYQAMEGTERPANLTEGCVAWKLTGETEFLGQAQIRLEWEKKIEKLDVGKSVDIDMPRLKSMDVDRAWGQIVLVKAETIDVTPSKISDSLRPIDPGTDLMSGASVTGAALALEFHEDWSLTVTATRYELQEIKRTSIERALVRMVVTRGKVTSVQAIYRMRSQRQRLEVELPENVLFDTEPLRINARPVTLEQGGTKKNRVAVPLIGLNPDAPFLLELRYTVSGAGLLLVCPAFPEEPAVQKVQLSVYLPKERAYLGSIGPWTDELVWWRTGIFSFRPVAIRDDESLIAWVTEGMNLDTAFLRNFETDGDHYLFSTLRPLAPPKGSLRIVALHKDALMVLVAVIVIGAGVLLTPQGFRKRALAVGAAVVALVLLAVFFPTLTRQFTSGWLIAWIIIVLVVWVLWYLLVTRPRKPEGGPPREPRGPALGAFWTTLKGKLRRRPKHKPEPVETKEPTPPEAEKKPDADSETGQGGKGNA